MANELPHLRISADLRRFAPDLDRQRAHCSSRLILIKMVRITTVANCVNKDGHLRRQACTSLQLARTIALAPMCPSVEPEGLHSSYRCRTALWDLPETTSRWPLTAILQLCARGGGSFDSSSRVGSRV